MLKVTQIAINIHIEGLNQNRFENGDNSSILQSLLDNKTPVALSFSPWQEFIWKNENPEFFNIAKKVLEINGNVLGQQGLNHKCKNKHMYADQWHENRCLWRPRLSYREQKEFMLEGRARLSNVFNKMPELYVPPNHYFDNTTLEVASDMGYRFFSEISAIPLKPFRVENMLVVPEGNLKMGNVLGRKAIYIHYDEIESCRVLFDSISNSSIPLNSISPERYSSSRWLLNEFLKYSRKYLRDTNRVLKRQKNKN
jgi:hypothetical protein